MKAVQDMSLPLNEWRWFVHVRDGVSRPFYATALVAFTIANALSATSAVDAPDMLLVLLGNEWCQVLR